MPKSSSVPIQQLLTAESSEDEISQKQQLIADEFSSYETMKLAAQFFKLGWTHYTVLMRIENEFVSDTASHLINQVSTKIIYFLSV